MCSGHLGLALLLQCSGASDLIKPLVRRERGRAAVLGRVEQGHPAHAAVVGEGAQAAGRGAAPGVAVAQLEANLSGGRRGRYSVGQTVDRTHEIS